VTGCGVMIFALGFLVTGRWARRTAQETASRLMPDTADQDAVGPGTVGLGTAVFGTAVKGTAPVSPAAPH
jgi:hypothetical protein